ncbi:MAG: hypothetical protein JXA18_10050 [Chitinispirillaceae bacterium]|nr:hypothetical protein [Chitinispirillaceae bacterium]
MIVMKPEWMLFLFVSIVPVSSKPVEPVTIDPTVTTFDSIPSPATEKTFFVGTVQDTSIARDENGIVGFTRIRRRKMAPIVCDPSPAIVVKRSVDGLLSKKGLKAEDPADTASTLEILVLDFSLKETSKRMSQTMEANIVLQATVINPADSTGAVKYIIKSQSSKSTIDTSKYAEAILRSAVENALKELIKSITR